jgi:hypothetical protein
MVGYIGQVSGVQNFLRVLFCPGVSSVGSLPAYNGATSSRRLGPGYAVAAMLVVT